MYLYDHIYLDAYMSMITYLWLSLINCMIKYMINYVTNVSIRK